MNLKSFLVSATEKLRQQNIKSAGLDVKILVSDGSLKDFND